MKIIRVAENNNIKKLNKIKELFGDVCEDLKKSDISSDAFSIKLDIMDLIYKLSE